MMSQKYFAFILVCALLSGAKAFAAEGGGSQFGVVYGYSVPDAENTNPRTLFGAKGAAFLGPTFSLGGYYLESQKRQGTGAVEFDYSLHGLEGAFHLGGGAGDTFVSILVGMSKVRTDMAGEDAIFSPYHYGVASGYDYFVLPWLTFGFEGSFVHVDKANTEKNSTAYDLDSFSIINFLVRLQLRL